jgi:hypothetical protein
VVTGTDTERIVGSDGAFGRNLVNGSVLATPNASSSVLKAGPLSKDASVHSARVLAYFQTAGIPASEVSGTHVTTEMEVTFDPGNGGLGREAYHLVRFATHLERQVAGIPVVSSQAWASFNARDEVISEGVHWPAIPIDIVSKAVVLRKLAEDPQHLASLQSQIRVRAPEIEDVSGRVVIAHTPPGYAGPVACVAGYEVTRPRERLASTRRFDEAANEVFLPSELAVPRSRAGSVQTR